MLFQKAEHSTKTQFKFVFPCLSKTTEKLEDTSRNSHV